MTIRSDRVKTAASEGRGPASTELVEMTNARWSDKVEASRISEILIFKVMPDEPSAAGGESVSRSERLDEAERQWTSTCVFKQPA